MTPALDAAIRACLCVCFPDDAAAFSETRFWHGTAPTFSLVARDAAGGVSGHIGIVVREIRVGPGGGAKAKADGEPVRIAGIQNMAVHPEARKTPMGRALIAGAMEEAVRRAVPHSLLFCVPELERYYARHGWTRHDVEVRMDHDGRTDIPIPGKNIAMVRPLADRPFPEGDIHLMGADW